MVDRGDGADQKPSASRVSGPPKIREASASAFDDQLNMRVIFITVLLDPFDGIINADEWGARGGGDCSMEQCETDAGPGSESALAGWPTGMGVCIVPGTHDGHEGTVS